MNDGQWLRHWCAQHVGATAGGDAPDAETLAREAEREAERDGFSVDSALREEGHDTLVGYFQDALDKRAAGAG